MVARGASATPRRLLAALALALAALLGLLAFQLTPLAASGPWSRLQPVGSLALDHVVIWDLVGDPTTPQTLAAATSRGVWMSFDGGDVWAQTPIKGLSWTVAFNPSGSTVFAGTSRQGVYRSLDGGQTWKQVNDGLRSLDVRAIAIGPTAVVLGTGRGVYYSGTGTGWASAGLTGLSISSLAIVANDPLGVVAGSDQLAQKDNLFRSLAVSPTGGWEALPGGDPGGAPVFAVAAGPLAKGASVPPLLVGNLMGLYASPDAGTTWAAQNLAAGVTWSADSIAFDPENPSMVYVGGNNGGSSGGGLQRSSDGGGSWAPFEQGLPASDVNSIDVLPTNPLTVLAALWNPASRTPSLARALDTSALGPVALSNATGTPISVPLSPTPSARPTARPHHQPNKTGPFPVLPVLVVLVVIVLGLVGFWLWSRRRRRRLEAEAPP